VKILIALAVYCTYGLQFYVCLEIAWNGIKNSFTKRPIISEYTLRTVLITLTGKCPFLIKFYITAIGTTG
jgi:proton-coupled amino acid transporter